MKMKEFEPGGIPAVPPLDPPMMSDPHLIVVYHSEYQQHRTCGPFFILFVFGGEAKIG